MKISLIFIEQLFYSATTFFVSILMAKYLSIREFGIWVIFNALYYFVVTIANASFWKLYIVKYNKFNGWIFKIFYTNSTFLLSVILSLFIAPIIALIFFYYYKLSIFTSVLLFLFAIFSIIYEVKRRIFIARNDGKSLLTLSITRILFFIFSILIMAEGMIINLELIFIYLVISLSLLSLYKVKNIFSLTLWPRVIRGHYKLLIKTYINDLKENRLLLAKSILHYFTSQLYVLIAGFYLSLEDLAFFEVIRLVFSPVMIIIVGLNSVFVLYLVSEYKKDRKSLMNNIIKITFLIGFVVSIYIVLVYLNIEVIVRYLFNEGYYNKDVPRAVIAFSLAILSASSIPFVMNYFLITETNKYALKSSIIVFFINLGFSPFLISSFGIMGIFIGVSFIQLSLLLINIYFMRKVNVFELNNQV
jgi:O-antigen/teichoic acid export membrane protein